MIKVHCEKSFKRTIDIRSTFIKAAKEQNVSIVVTCDQIPGESIYSVEELDSPIRIQKNKNGELFKSKFDKEPYSLYVFNWKK